MKTIQGVTRVKDGVIRIMLQPLQLLSSWSFADCSQWLCHASSGRGAKTISKTKVLALRLPHFALQFRKLLSYSNPLQSLQHFRTIPSSGKFYRMIFSYNISQYFMRIFGSNREGLSSGNGATPPASHSSRSDPAQNPQALAPQANKEVSQPRVYYLSARPSSNTITNSPRQPKVIQQQQQQRTKLNSSSGRSGNGSRQHHRSSPRSANNHHYYINPSHHHHRQPVPPEARSLTTDTSFHSDSFYPDWSAHPHHIRLPHPSPESSFDQLWDSIV